MVWTKKWLLHITPLLKIHSHEIFNHFPLIFFSEYYYSSNVSSFEICRSPTLLSKPMSNFFTQQKLLLPSTTHCYWAIQTAHRPKFTQQEKEKKKDPNKILFPSWLFELWRHARINSNAAPFLLLEGIPHRQSQFLVWWIARSSNQSRIIWNFIESDEWLAIWIYIIFLK